MANPDRARILRRIRQELKPGQVVNLGVGLPTGLADLIAPDSQIYLHSENGILGVGPAPATPEEADPALVNASKMPVTILPGASFFDSAESFAMIRGGHVDVAVIGGLEVDQRGILANWLVPGQNVLGVGGAMDLVSGVRQVIVAMTHVTRDGAPKIVAECSYPITSMRPIDTLVTERAVFRVCDGRLLLTDIAAGYTLDDIHSTTSAAFDVADELGTFE